MNSDSQVQRGEVYFADLSPVIGSEQSGRRPVVIVQNNVGNAFSPTTIVAALTGKTERHHLPTHVPISHSCKGIQKDSIVLVEQIRTIDKSRLCECIGMLDSQTMDSIDHALMVSLQLEALE